MPYQFHHRVHEKWGEQSLHFWFFAFRASCDPHELKRAMRQVLEEHGATAHATYELIGHYDLMLRVWLPVSRINTFQTSLDQAFNPLTLNELAHFTVTEHVRHWPWAPRRRRHRRGPIRPVNDDLLQARPTESQLRALNALTNGSGERLPRALSRFERGHAITPAPPSPGIKLVTLVTPTGRIDLDTQRALKTRITAVLDRSDPKIFSECSLYANDGEAALFLIMCRIATDRYDELRPKLFDILQAPLLGTARTTTYAVVGSGFLPIKDEIPLIPAPDGGARATIAELLQDDESHTLEIKASAFAPVDPWLREGKPLTETPACFDSGVLKAVAGFLNSDRGGTVVIGAIETHRYRDVNAELDERLDELPSVGAYTCLGLVDPTFQRGGWDKFGRRLLETIESRLTPHALGRLRVGRKAYKGKPLCVIHVDPWNGDPWTYTKDGDKFYVRDGPRVRALRTADADTYKTRRESKRRTR